MLQSVEWAEDRTYRTGSDNEPLQFYLQALSNSNRLDLLLGYFSSAAISVLSIGFAKFLSTGGTIRMIVNNILSEKDKESVKKGLAKQDSSIVYNLSDINKLKDTLDEYGYHFFECLAWLISNEKIQIKIIKPKIGNGISHYKSGVFSDGTDQVCFKGSCNFTAYGLLENLEEITTFSSWDDNRSLKEINNQNNYFEEIFEGRSDNVEFVDINNIHLAIKSEFSGKDINDLVIQEKELIRKKKLLFENKKLKKILTKVEEDIFEYIRKPRFPYPEGPRKYQEEAYSKWQQNNFKGIFAMATGTGKTITSLNCLLNLYKETGSYKAIITVPTTALLVQWKKECAKFNFSNVITISSKEKWNDKLSFFNTATKLTNTSFIVIVTYASLIKPKFQSHFKQLPTDTLLIADEVHNMGSTSLSRLLPAIHLNKRIGLSATPKRKYDIEGNAALEFFFNDKPPFVFSYSMKQALDVGWLCPYTYFPHIVYLTDTELNEYLKISKQLMKYLDSVTGKYKECKEVEELLLKRKRIIHKAYNKKNVFKEITHSEFARRKNLKYTLVYVPEGLEPDYSKIDEYEENDDESNLINEYTRIVKETDDSVMVKQFTSKTINREEVIDGFEKGIVHVLTSMKCLDEGVDVPRSELAIFCSSTGNPRQFIQRRGRILRNHKDKIHAVIHDLVVMPKINAESGNFDMEKNLIKKELERVVDFSDLSMNKIDTYEELKDILDYYNINLNDLISE